MDAQPHFYDGHVTTLIDAWSTTMEHLSELISSLSGDQWGQESPCPGWTLGDISAHVTGLERRLAGDPLADHEPDWATLAHVRDSDFARFMERDVDVRRGQAREATVAELIDVIPRRRGQLLALGADPEVLVTGPAGTQVPLGRIMPMRVFDLWVHEQDIRRAIGVPDHEASIGAHVTAETLVSSVPMIWGKKVAAEPGRSLRLQVSGPISFDLGVQIGPDGRAVFITPEPHSTTTIGMGWLTYASLATGRDTFTQVQGQIQIDGDSSLAIRLLESLNVAP
jgi:uncharacterized protein (TIGR03083 family)